MATELLFRDDAYLKTATARVVAVMHFVLVAVLFGMALWVSFVETPH